MGLSSSQARLLTLTGRMHDIEYKAQKLEAQKLMLANETRQVYDSYLKVLEATKIQNKVLGADGSVSFIDSTYTNLIGTKVNENTIYALRDTETGKAIVDKKYKGAYESSNKTLDGFLKTLNSISSVESNSYTSVTSVEGLMAMSNSSGNFRLDSDLTLENWTGIRMFKGNFDGNGHTITIKSGTSGLFNTASGATIKNINIDANIDNSNSNRTGALVNQCQNTTIENVGVSGSVTGARWVGGLAGVTFGNCNIKNCYSSATVYANQVSESNGYDPAEENFDISYAGGLVGRTMGGASATVNFENCTASGDVYAEYWFAGGFTGVLNSNTNFTNCVASGNVYANISGRGDSFRQGYWADGSVMPRNISSFNADTVDNTITIVVNNCNAMGNVSTGGNAANENISDFCFVENADVQFNGFYSTLDDSESSGESPIVYTPDTNPAHYSNLSEEDFEQALLVFAMIEKMGGAVSVPEGYENDSEWFSNFIISGAGLISQVDISNKNDLGVYDVSVAIDTNLQEVPDESELRKAEAKYEADMRKIDLKDRKYDALLAAVESERNAIKSEMETLKTVAKDNVERTFKLFS